MNQLTINFVVSKLKADFFTGGIYCILKHADGLVRRGHSVNIISSPGSEKPQWIDCGANIICPPAKKKIVKYLEKSLLGKARYKSAELKHAFTDLSAAEHIPESDITIATLWETVPTVFKYGTGARGYFMQHFEPVFAQKGSLDEILAQHSYLYPLHKIANSSWLKSVIEDFVALNGIQENIYYASNAVDLDIYCRYGPADQKKDERSVRIISYGGRGVTWKGFLEMAQGMALARQRLPGYNLEWFVYGEAALSPDNEIAPYTHLGFLQPQQLAEAYNQAEILLSASWYESFPLFPIEAMACGLAVITTAKGTEDYAVDGETAQIVDPCNPESVAKALVNLVVNRDYRLKIAENGYKVSQQFGWIKAAAGMEKILQDIVREKEIFSRQSRNLDGSLSGLI